MCALDCSVHRLHHDHAQGAADYSWWLLLGSIGVTYCSSSRLGDLGMLGPRSRPGCPCRRLFGRIMQHHTRFALLPCKPSKCSIDGNDRDMRRTTEFAQSCASCQRSNLPWSVCAFLPVFASQSSRTVSLHHHGHARLQPCTAYG
jgi:hypothetical protein